MTLCEKEEKFGGFVVGELLRVLGNTSNLNVPLECGLLLLTIMVEKIMLDREIEKKIENYLKNFHKDFFLENRIRTFLTMELYNAYIDEFETGSFSELPNFLLNLIF